MASEYLVARVVVTLVVVTRVVSNNKPSARGTGHRGHHQELRYNDGHHEAMGFPKRSAHQLWIQSHPSAVRHEIQHVLQHVRAG